MEVQEFTQQRATQDKWKTRAYAGVAVVAGCLLAGLVLYIFGILWQAVATVITTAVIAFMLHATVNYLERKGLSRLISTTIAMLAFLALIIGGVALFVPPVLDQISALTAAAPTYAADARAFLEQSFSLISTNNSVLGTLIDQASTWVQESGGGILSAAAGGILSGVTGLSNGLIIFSIALICAFWVLIDLPTMSREVMMLFSEEQAKNVRVVSGAFSTAVYGWMRATLVCAIVTGVVTGVAYWILGVPYFVLLGMLCGVLYIIPYIGPVVSSIIVVLVGLLVSPAIAIGALVVNTVVVNVVGSILSPRLMRSSVSVHPAVSLVVILVGGALGGIVGMLFSIPIAAAAQGVFITFFEERTGRKLATEDGALFRKPKVRTAPTMRKRPPKKADSEEQ